METEKLIEKLASRPPGRLLAQGALMIASPRMRRVRFSPYRNGMGPTFTLDLFEPLPRSGDRVGYRLTMRHRGAAAVLFEGRDFGPSPLHSIDGDDSVRSLMGFLTLRPGDTDADYFEAYTPEQAAYCAEHAEALSLAVLDRFGEG